MAASHRPVVGPDARAFDTLMLEADQVFLAWDSPGEDQDAYDDYSSLSESSDTGPKAAPGSPDAVAEGSVLRAAAAAAIVAGIAPGPGVRAAALRVISQVRRTSGGWERLCSGPGLPALPPSEVCGALAAASPGLGLSLQGALLQHAAEAATPASGGIALDEVVRRTKALCSTLQELCAVAEGSPIAGMADEPAASWLPAGRIPPAFALPEIEAWLGPDPVAELLHEARACHHRAGALVALWSVALEAGGVAGATAALARMAHAGAAAGAGRAGEWVSGAVPASATAAGHGFAVAVLASAAAGLSGGTGRRDAEVRASANHDREGPQACAFAAEGRARLPEGSSLSDAAASLGRDVARLLGDAAALGTIAAAVGVLCLGRAPDPAVVTGSLRAAAVELAVLRVTRVWPDSSCDAVPADIRRSRDDRVGSLARPVP